MNLTKWILKNVLAIRMDFKCILNMFCHQPIVSKKLVYTNQKSFMIQIKMAQSKYFQGKFHSFCYTRNDEKKICFCALSSLMFFQNRWLCHLNNVDKIPLVKLNIFSLSFLSSKNAQSTNKISVKTISRKTSNSKHTHNTLTFFKIIKGLFGSESFRSWRQGVRRPGVLITIYQYTCKSLLQFNSSAWFSWC